jgi:NitT/TauT family transport system substrate-binding protein
LNKKEDIIMKKQVLILLILILASCSPSLETEKKLYSEEITIGLNYWPGNIAIYLAKEKGFFEDAGLNVNIKSYVSLKELSKDYVNGEMKGRANLVLDAINEAYEELDHKIVLAIDHSTGSDAIIARKGIDTPSDVKGRKVSYESGTLEEFFLSWMLKEIALTLDDIIPVEGNPEETAEMLKKGEIDVAVTHEPYITKLLGSNEFNIIYSSKDSPGLITDVLTFRTDFIQEHPDTVEEIVHAYFRGLKYLKEYPDESYQIYSKETGESPESIAEQLKGITLLDERDNTDAFTFAAGLSSLYVNARNIGMFVKEQREEDFDINTDNLITKQFQRHFTIEHNSEHEGDEKT